MPLRMTLIAIAVIASAQPQANPNLYPPVSLADFYHDGIDVSQYWYSEKLDGIRAYWTGQHLVTRNGIAYTHRNGSFAYCPITHWMGSCGQGEVTFILCNKRYWIRRP